VGRPEGEILLGRPRSRWENNIKMDLREVGSRHWLDSFGTGQEEMAGACECANELPDFIKCREFLD
jgi:hypothetical protein